MQSLSAIKPKLQQEFKQVLSKLSPNISKHIINTLANMLAIDYVARLGSKTSLQEHLEKCLVNLQAALKQKVIDSDDFSFALELFAIAITGKYAADEDDEQARKKQSQEQIIEALINLHFSDVAPQTRQKIAAILASILSGKSIDEKVNYLNSKPELIRSIVMQQLAKSQAQIPPELYTLNKLVSKTTELKKYTDTFKETASKIASAACALGVVAISAIDTGATLPATVLPATILSVKYAPKLGALVAEKILGINSTVKDKKAAIKQLGDVLAQTHGKDSQIETQVALEQEQTKQIAKNIALEALQLQTNSANIDLVNIKKNFISKDTEAKTTSQQILARIKQDNRSQNMNRGKS